MSRAILALVLLSIARANVQTLPSLPPGAIANCVQLDSSGNIFVAGTLNKHIFAAKLTPDGSQLVYMTTVSGSNLDVAQAIAVGSDGSAYVTGYTQSTDFPTTPGAAQPTIPAQGDILHPFAFALKLNAQGAVQYATYLGGTAFTRGNGIAIDGSGNAYITGMVSGNFSGYPATPGAISGYLGDDGLYSRQSGFIVKLDPAGSTALISILGFGGSQIAVDPAGNILAAGAPTGPTPTTPNAFQTSAPVNVCFTNFFTGPILCNYQHVAKIDPTGQTLLFGTYVAGSLGATPSAMAFDADGNIVLVGTTNSPNFPVTPYSYQSHYLFQPSSTFIPNDTLVPPAPAGFVTKLNSDGSGLIWSTFFSGTGSDPSYEFLDGDTITGMAIDAAGNIVISGTTKSPDLPGLWNVPVSQRPKTSQMPTASFVTRFTPDGVRLSPTQLLPYFGSNANSLALSADGSAIVVPQLARVTLSDPPRVAAITDAFYNRLLRVAPGQRITVWGTRIAPGDQPQPSAPYPTSANGITVTFNGIAAQISYAGGDQVNLQVPFEIAGQTELTMQVTGQLGDPPFSESFLLGVINQ